LRQRRDETSGRRWHEPRFSCEQLAGEWKLYLENLHRSLQARARLCEGNFPVDHFGSTYETLWNAFKRCEELCGRRENGCSAARPRRLNVA
jgi:hypothetical protein